MNQKLTEEEACDGNLPSQACAAESAAQAHKEYEELKEFTVELSNATNAEKLKLARELYAKHTKAKRFQKK